MERMNMWVATTLNTRKARNAQGEVQLKLPKNASRVVIYAQNSKMGLF